MPGVFYVPVLAAGSGIFGLWGDNYSGQASPPDVGARRAVMVAAGGFHSLALLADGA
eukprot:gene8559-1767_t